MKRSFAASLLLAGILVGQVFAAETGDAFQAQRWVADPAKSRLSFQATQEGEKFGGRFDKFTAGVQIAWAAGEYSLQQVDAVIQLESVDTDYGERDDYLVQEDWFYTQLWPEAQFSSTVIADNGDGRYTADGTLMLRGISKDVQIALQLSIEENGERGKLLGTASINRLDFGVGQGDWSDTEWIGDAVDVEFELYLLRSYE